MMKVIKNYLYLLKIFLEYGKKYVLLLALTTLLSPVATVIDTVIIKEALDAIENKNPIDTIIPFLLIYIFAACSLYLVGALFARFSSLELIEIGNRMNKDVFNMAKEKDYVNSESPDFYDSYSWTVQGYYSRSLAAVKSIASFFNILLTVIAIIGLIASVDCIVITFSLLNLFSVVLLNIITRKLDYKRSLELLKYDRFDAYVHRIFYIPEYAADIRITGLCKHLVEKFDENKNERIKISKRYLNKNLVISFFIKLIPMIIFVITIIYLVAKTAKGTTSYGDFALLLTASQNLTSELLIFTDLLPNIVEQGLYAQKMVEFESMESRIESCNAGKELSNNACAISFENVSFSYVNSSNNAITDFSCVITPKQKTAIVGKNGAGKSTIVKLLLRLYDPKEGRICINGVDLREYSIKSLRNAIGIVMQNSKLYALTLRENVFLNGLDESMSDGELDELFSMVDLKIPQHGYDMLVTKEFEEDGLMFSGGEKQKISLIRSMVQYYPLIVLDEPTASLDPISEGKYIDAVYNSFNDSTVIMIAHRLSAIKNFNNILVLDNGRIVESGTHDELMKRHGMYYTMFMNQAKRYEDDGK